MQKHPWVDASGSHPQRSECQAEDNEDREREQETVDEPKQNRGAD
jgi:hypothetical protein